MGRNILPIQYHPANSTCFAVTRPDVLTLVRNRLVDQGNVGLMKSCSNERGDWVKMEI